MAPVTYGPPSDGEETDAAMDEQWRGGGQQQPPYAIDSQGEYSPALNGGLASAPGELPWTGPGYHDGDAQSADPRAWTPPPPAPALPTPPMATPALPTPSVAPVAPIAPVTPAPIVAPAPVYQPPVTAPTPPPLAAQAPPVSPVFFGVVALILGVFAAVIYAVMNGQKRAPANTWGGYQSPYGRR